jgi:type III pantothenate kinase
VVQIVADLGNTRLKWARLDRDGNVEGSDFALAHDFSAWDRFETAGSSWAIASVNPPVADRLGRYLEGRNVEKVRWYRSASDVPVRHRLATPESTGTDRALAVAAVIARKPEGRPAQVVLCGTAVTVERISTDGVWLGGAIAPGLGLSARALHTLTAQLPEVTPPTAPQPWGDATRPALEAGIYWGTVGAIREILARQAIGLGPDPWIVWTGGDAHALGPMVVGGQAEIVPDLVLHGLARVAFGAGR